MLLITPGGDTYLSSRSYSRRGYSVPRFYDDTYIPRYVPSKQFLDTSGEENAIRKNVNRELMLTSHFVDDAYDLASNSHRRDEEILKHANQAIVDTEIYHNPRIAVASRRARSQPPQALQVSPVIRARASVPPRGASPPPRSYVRRANREVVVVVRPRSASVAAEVDFRKPVTAGWRYSRDYSRDYSRGYYSPYAFPWYRYLPRRNFYVDTPGGVDTRSHYMYGTSLAFPLYSRLYTPYLYQNGYDYILPQSSQKYTKARLRVLASPLPYKKKFARKAALVGSKVDVVLPNNKRPRSKYAAAVIREINLKKHWGEEGHTEPAEMPTSHLHASPKPVGDELSSFIVESSETSINTAKENENSVNTTHQSENSVNATHESENSVITIQESENSVNTTQESENPVNTTQESENLVNTTQESENSENTTTESENSVNTPNET